MSRALSNLIDNAVRYAPPGTAVEIAIEAADAEVAVTVTDHGAGIAAEERERIFQRFWRGRRDVPGTGLGLPIARQIALAHGGDLVVTSLAPRATAAPSASPCAAERSGLHPFGWEPW
ncbi:sensor histidine kinase [Nonomuraea recticatena]|uniref:sensor histidine kinase n=1 Tax=Nonomuraea recticatena TaxID=46178 RepID=UPI00360D1CC1